MRSTSEDGANTVLCFRFLIAVIATKTSELFRTIVINSNNFGRSLHCLFRSLYINKI